MAYRKVDPGLAKGFEEQFTIGIVVKNVLAAITAVHHVINGSFVLNAQLASHGETLNRSASLSQSVIYLGPTPFCSESTHFRCRKFHRRESRRV